MTWKMITLIAVLIVPMSTCVAISERARFDAPVMCVEAKP
jgi:hypothetical protein